MRFCLTFALLTWPALALAGGDSAAAKAEVKKLQGTWKVTAVTYNGKDFYEKAQTPFDFIFKDNEILVQGNDAVKKEYARMKFTLDTTVMPKIFDLSVVGGIQKDAKLEGIYELKGDECKLCIRVFGMDRPSEFAAPGGSNNAYLILKKQ